VTGDSEAKLSVPINVRMEHKLERVHCILRTGNLRIRIQTYALKEGGRSIQSWGAHSVPFSSRLVPFRFSRCHACLLLGSDGITWARRVTRLAHVIGSSHEICPNRSLLASSSSFRPQPSPSPSKEREAGASACPTRSCCCWWLPLSSVTLLGSGES
jgi:hypothetical protein